MIIKPACEGVAIAPQRDFYNVHEFPSALRSTIERINASNDINSLLVYDNFEWGRVNGAGAAFSCKWEPSEGRAQEISSDSGKLAVIVRNQNAIYCEITDTISHAHSGSGAPVPGMINFKMQRGDWVFNQANCSWGKKDRDIISETIRTENMANSDNDLVDACLNN